MNKVIVKTHRKKYPVFIGDGILPQLRQKIEGIGSPDIFAVVDENVAKYHFEMIKKLFRNYPGKVEYFKLPQGEKAKSFHWFKQIHTSLLEGKFGKDTTLVAFGGGVTGDISGFAAATFMRGIKLIHVPTTLLASVDSSIGGKTGINFHQLKNMIGSFYQPEFVFTDTQFLTTLPKREFNSALGEIIKYAFISGSTFFDFVDSKLDGNDLSEKKIISTIIKECVTIKASVVSRDEYEETGIRKILNFGHTFAHAIESTLNYKIKHGEAVAAGISAALFLSNKMGLTDNRKLNKFLVLTAKVPPPKTIMKLSVNDAVKFMQSDKKVRNNRTLFVLIKDIGKILVDVPAGKRAIVDSLKQMKNFYFG